MTDEQVVLLINAAAHATLAEIEAEREAAKYTHADDAQKSYPIARAAEMKAIAVAARAATLPKQSALTPIA